jgi:hypothetical protein
MADDCAVQREFRLLQEERARTFEKDPEKTKKT